MNNPILHRNNVNQADNWRNQFRTCNLLSPENFRILVVDDEDPLRNLLEASLRRLGYNVVAACDGETALEIFEQEEIDLVLLDVVMPGIDGYETCTEIRKHSDVPIVMLTALNRPDDIVHGFNIGADDYIPKPFTFREVEARLQSILRRISWITEKPSFCVLAHGDITVDDEKQIVIVRGEKVELTPIEYQLLVHVMRSPDQPVSKDELFRHVWGYEQSGGTNLVEVAIRRLREKIEVNPSEPVYLVTVRGAGYKFSTEHSLARVAIAA